MPVNSWQYSGRELGIRNSIWPQCVDWRSVEWSALCEPMQSQAKCASCALSLPRLCRTLDCLNLLKAPFWCTNAMNPRTRLYPLQFRPVVKHRWYSGVLQSHWYSYINSCACSPRYSRLNKRNNPLQKEMYAWTNKILTNTLLLQHVPQPLNTPDV